MSSIEGLWLLWRPMGTDFDDCVLDMSLDGETTRFEPNVPQFFSKKEANKMLINARGAIHRVAKNGRIPVAGYDPVKGEFRKSGRNVALFGEKQPASKFFQPLSEDQYREWLIANDPKAAKKK